MARSRSSFDLSVAIATATSLSTAQGEEAPSAVYRGMALVSFGPTAAGPPSVPPPPPEAPPPSEGSPGSSPLVAESSSSPNLPSSSHGDAPESHALHDSHMPEARRPPLLPDLSHVPSPIQRAERIVAWIVEAVGAQDVFIADAAGLPIAGSVTDVEARLAASGVVASAVLHLAAGVPGNSSALFELHVGEGPFFQLVGFEIAGAHYIVGLTRATPLSYRQAHAVRLACRHALGEPGRHYPESAERTSSERHHSESAERSSSDRAGGGA